MKNKKLKLKDLKSQKFLTSMGDKEMNSVKGRNTVYNNITAAQTFMHQDVHNANDNHIIDSEKGLHINVVTLLIDDGNY